MSDPYLQREKMRYKHPVASREFILKVLEDARRPLRFNHIVKMTSTGDDQSDVLKRRLNAMVRDGQIKFTARSCYVPSGKIVKKSGVVQRLKDGSVELVQSDESLIPVPGIDASLLLSGDEVSYRTVKQGQKSHAVVIDIIKRELQYLLGMIEVHGDRTYFISLQRGMPRMKVSSMECGDVDHLQIVKASVYVKARNWQVTVTDIVGNALDADIPEMIAQHISVLTKPMDDDVKEQVNALAKTDIESDAKGRTDWSHLPLVTIDGETARDYDDAVMAETKPCGGFKIYVAIADVSHYVPVGSPLDRYAYGQTTSIYFPKMCVPMLPEVLSNDLCSLMPNVPRLAMGACIHLDADGEITGGDVQRVLIRSKSRLTYESIDQMLSGENITPKWFESSLSAMTEVTHVLKKRSARRRALNILSRLDSIAFDSDGAWETMESKDACFSHGLIEKMMVTANHFIAKFLLDKGQNAIFRHHPSVRPEGFSALLREMQHADIETSDDYDLYDVNEQLRTHEKYKYIAPWVVRAMAQARYETKLTEHWGLSLDAYVHFTSPIRRYPDLMIHRALAAVIDGERDVELAPAKIEYAAKRCSRLERRADASVYDASDWYQCQWVYKHLDQSFEGLALTMLAFGVFVKLTSSAVEVLLPAHHLESLGYKFDFASMQWSHPRLGPLLLGHSMMVRLTQVSFPLRRRDAIWVDVPKDSY